MREEKISELGVTLETLSEKLHRLWAHLIVTHENLLDVCISSQRFRNRCHLLFIELIFKEVQISKRKDLEQFV